MRSFGAIAGRLMGLVLVALGLVVLGVNDEQVSAAIFRPQINVTNSAAPIPEPSPENTGQIEWLENQIYEFASGEYATVEIDYDLKLFTRVTINGSELVLNRDYSLEEGSTVIALESSYLRELPVGTYDLTAYYADGQSFTTDFTVVEPPEDTEGTLAVPNTGEDANDIVSTASDANIPVIIGGIIVAIASLVLIGTVRRYYRLKRDDVVGRQRTKMLFAQDKGYKQSEKNLLANLKIVASPITSRVFSREGDLPHLAIKHHKLMPIAVSTGVVILGVCIGTSAANTNLPDENVVATAPEQTTLAISTSVDNFTGEADLANGNAFIYTSQDVSVTTATQNGYQLYLSTSSDEYNDLSINGSTSAEERITATSGTFEAPGEMETDAWGYALANDVFGNNYSPSASSLWAGVPVKGAEVLVKNVEGATSANDSTTFYYGFNVTNNLPDGSYWGTNNNTVIYTAVANPVVEYTITYSCNGGTGTIQDQIKGAGATAVLNNGAACTFEGNTITGWNTAADGSGIDYALNGNYSEDADLNLFAVWEANAPVIEEHTYSLEYNANGGTGAPAKQSATTTDDNTEFTISTSTPTFDGHTFIGWSVSETAAAADYQPGDLITVTTATTTLYAVWEVNVPPVVEYTYTLHYNANGGTGAPVEQSMTTAANKVSFNINTATPSRSGYVFKGWSTSSSASTASYQPGGTITVTNTNTTLYAVWAQEHTYTLKYNANGGTGAPADQSITNTASSTTFTISSTKPTRSDYTFKGWSTSSSATKATYQPGDSVKITATTTLYAVWQANKHTYTLKYNANGGSGAPADQSVTNTASSATFTISSTEPTRSGYTFKGWGTSASATTAAYQPGGSITASAATTTLYAVWQVNPPVKVSGITISGTQTINLNSSSPKTTLSATVTPSNAANKSVTWSSSNNNVATVSSTGVVTGVEAGTATITAKANDGSGKSATYKITVNKKVIIIIGASQVARFGGSSYANIQSYTDSSSSNIYKRGNGTLNFVYKSGTGFAYQNGDGWTSAYNIIQKYSGSKSQTTFYVYFPMAGNDIKTYTCGQIGSTNSTIKGYATNFNNKITSARNNGYNVNGLVVSVQPLKPTQATSSYIVSNSNTSKRCSANYRSNYKYYKFNAAMKSIVEGANYANLKYVPLFRDIMDTSDDTHYTFKSGWTSYSTTDGMHWNNDTAVKYLNAMLNKNSAL